MVERALEIKKVPFSDIASVCADTSSFVLLCLFITFGIAMRVFLCNNFFIHLLPPSPLPNFFFFKLLAHLKRLHGIIA